MWSCRCNVGRWAGVIWVAMEIRLVRRHIWTKWQRRECSLPTSIQRVPYAHRVSSLHIFDSILICSKVLTDWSLSADCKVLKLGDRIMCNCSLDNARRRLTTFDVALWWLWAWSIVLTQWCLSNGFQTLRIKSFNERRVSYMCQCQQLYRCIPTSL